MEIKTALGNQALAAAANFEAFVTSLRQASERLREFAGKGLAPPPPLTYTAWPDRDDLVNQIRDAISRQRQEKRNEHLSAIHEKAKELLKSVLTPYQWGCYMRGGGFVVTGGRSKRNYLIYDARTFNIVDLRFGHTYCCTPAVHLPIADALAAQALTIEVNETLFLGNANRGTDKNRATVKSYMQTVLYFTEEETDIHMEAWSLPRE